MKELLLNNWSVMRVLRVVIGLVALANGISTSEIFLMVIGGIVLFQGITNTGCGGACTSGNCEVKSSNKK